MKQKKAQNNVRKYRRVLDLTQEELANSVSVHRQTIIAIEKQKYEPSIGTVLRISSALNQPVEKLFFLNREETNKWGYFDAFK